MCEQSPFMTVVTSNRYLNTGTLPTYYNAYIHISCRSNNCNSKKIAVNADLNQIFKCTYFTLYNYISQYQLNINKRVIEVVIKYIDNAFILVLYTILVFYTFCITGNVRLHFHYCTDVRRIS